MEKKKWHLLTLNTTSGYFDLTFDTLKSIIMGFFVAYNNPSLVNDQFTTSVFVLWHFLAILLDNEDQTPTHPPPTLLPTPVLSFP